MFRDAQVASGSNGVSTRATVVPLTAPLTDDPFVRTWDLYLAGSQAAFMTGSLQLFQVVFTRNRNNDVPWTRGSERRESP